MPGGVVCPFVPPQARGAGESQVPALPARGHLGSQRLAARARLGVPGVLKDPSFPKAWEGSPGVLVACSPPRAQGCPVSVTLSPTLCTQLPPCATVGTTGCSPPLPGTPAAVPSLCRALPRSAPLPWWAPVPRPTRSTPRWHPQGRRHRGERPRRCLRLPAALLCFQEEKKSNGNSLV